LSEFSVSIRDLYLFVNIIRTKLSVQLSKVSTIRRSFILWLLSYLVVVILRALTDHKEMREDNGRKILG